MNADDNDLVELGVITGAHGIRGDVIIKPFTETPLHEFDVLTDKTGQTRFEITRLKTAGKGRIAATIKNITTRNDAEALKGTTLCIARCALPEPEEDEFYYTDLIGLETRLETGELFGTIINLANHGAGDILEILPQNSQTSMYLLFTKENIPALDIEKGYITIVLPDEIDGEQRK